MKPIVLVCLFVAGAMANTVSVSYGTAMKAAPVISYGSPAPEVRVPSYAAPVTSYSAPAPAPAAPVQPAYGGYGAAEAAPGLAAPVIPITRYNHEIKENGHHSIEFETGHGIRHSGQTTFRLNPDAVPVPEDSNHGKALLTKTGSYSYKSPDGKDISLTYVADENGFRPVGDHLPTPPPIPAEIQAALRQIQEMERQRDAGKLAAPAAGAYGGY